MRQHYCRRHRDDYDPCDVCLAYERRKAANSQGKVLPFYVTVEGISRSYGGPEEGGWWYDRRTILAIRRVYTVSAALRTIRELREEFPQPRYNRFSCANRGENDIRIAVCYDESDPRWPEETQGRPSYE